MLYTDGLITLFSFEIYATDTFNFTFNDIILFGIAINITAAVGAYIFGFIEDKIGIKKVILTSLVLLIIICVAILIIDNKTYFWILGTMIGVFIGSIQSSSRTALISLSDSKNINSLFGIYAMSGKVTNFLGPLLVATFTTMFESQKAGMATILIFLVLGLFLFNKVKYKESYIYGIFKNNIYKCYAKKKTYQFLNLKIYPNKSLTLITLVAFFIVFSLATTFASFYFILLGAWPVSVFLFADFILLYLAFIRYNRDSKIYDRIILKKNYLLLMLKKMVLKTLRLLILHGLD